MKIIDSTTELWGKLPDEKRPEKVFIRAENENPDNPGVFNFIVDTRSGEITVHKNTKLWHLTHIAPGQLRRMLKFLGKNFDEALVKTVSDESREALHERERFNLRSS